MSMTGGVDVKMSGGALQERVIDTARPFGWKIAHFRPLRTAHGWRTPVSADGKGWPDLFLVHPDRGVVLYREIKGQYEKLTPEQEQWGVWLCSAAQDWGVWRPRMWPAIVATLTFGRGSVQ